MEKSCCCWMNFGCGLQNLLLTGFLSPLLQRLEMHSQAERQLEQGKELNSTTPKRRALSAWEGRRSLLASHVLALPDGRWFADVSGLCTFPPRPRGCCCAAAMCCLHWENGASCSRKGSHRDHLELHCCPLCEISTGMGPLWHSHK